MKIRVLIVDEAVLRRRLLTEALSGDPELEVVGSAADGHIALTKVPLLNPDLLVLDTELPDVNGQETLAALRRAYPLLPVVLFNRLAGPRSAGSAHGLRAEGPGAAPADREGEAAAALRLIREQLIPRIKLLHGRTQRAPKSPPPAPDRSGSKLLLGIPGRVDVVAVAASTGGPEALAALLPALPADCPVPVVIVQHMPPDFTRRLAERLAARSAVEVREAIDGAILEPGQAWLAPGDHHLVVAREGGHVRLRTHQAAAENSCRPSADVLFRSVAQVYGAGALAVVLTGMGQDGLRGCESVRHAAGQVLVQDAASSVVWGMPGFVARAGLADQVLPLDQLGPEVVRRLRRGRSLLFTPDVAVRGKTCP